MQRYLVPPLTALARAARHRRALLRLLWVMLVSVGIVTIVQFPAVAAQTSAGAADVDIRAGAATPLRPTRAQMAELATLPAATVQWNDWHGVPSSLISHTG